MDVHQDLKEQNLIVQWQDVPSDGEIVFVSHEWLSWAHPDPRGEQLKVLCCALERLRDGKIDRVDMDPLHTIAYVVFEREARELQSCHSLQHSLRCQKYSNINLRVTYLTHLL